MTPSSGKVSTSPWITSMWSIQLSTATAGRFQFSLAGSIGSYEAKARRPKETLKILILAPAQRRALYHEKREKHEKKQIRLLPRGALEPILRPLSETIRVGAPGLWRDAVFCYGVEACQLYLDRDWPEAAGRWARSVTRPYGASRKRMGSFPGGRLSSAVLSWPSRPSDNVKLKSGRVDGGTDWSVLFPERPRSWPADSQEWPCPPAAA